MKFVFLQLSLAAVPLTTPMRVFAIDSYTAMLQSTGTYQANLTQSMINYNRMNGIGSGGGPAPCMPPYELQRGPAGIVPPELQGDPRYQEYLRCLQHSSGPQAFPQNGPAAPPAALAQHQPINLSDFVPVTPGHPFAEQALANMPIDPKQRQALQSSVEGVFRKVANDFRGNNLAVAMAFTYTTANDTLTGRLTSPQQIREAVLAVNDLLAQSPNFSQMTAAQRQTASDSLIFQSAMILLLRNMGQQDADAKQKSVELARVVMKQLTGS